MRTSALLLGLLLIGAGCVPAGPVATLPTEPPAAAIPAPAAPVEQDTNSAPPRDEGGTAPREPAPTPAPFYIAYSAEQYRKALSEKRPVVLYFWASWCPICRADEPLIKARIENSGLPIAGFRVDFDSQDDLKQQFRIPYQHTTVMLGTDGAESTRFTGPVDEATFLAALRKAAGAR